MVRFQVFTIIAGLMTFGLAACRGSEAPSHLQFDSDQMVALDARLTDGYLITSSDDPSVFTQDLLKQLKFIIGQMGEGSGAMPTLLSSEGPQFRSIQPDGQGLFRIDYTLDFLVAWPRPTDQENLPHTYTLALPTQTDDVSLAQFTNNYSLPCGDHPKPDEFFYYYNPYLPGCPLLQSPPPPGTEHFTISLTPSAHNTTGRSPEYDKLWEDGRLKVVFVSGNPNHASAPRGGERFLERMQETYGPATSMQRDETPIYHYITATYESSQGDIAVEVVDFLQESIRRDDPDLAARIATATRHADFVAYNGHSGLGANIQRFLDQVSFSQGQYVIYWLNACRPFSYLLPSFLQRIEAANPGTPASRYLDIMSVSDIGNFARGYDIKTLVDAFVEKEKTYRAITTSIDRGKPVVWGEEDNRWPEPFSP